MDGEGGAAMENTALIQDVDKPIEAEGTADQTDRHNSPTTVARADPRLPIRRSHPGPIIRAGVVSLWAPGRDWREPAP